MGLGGASAWSCFVRWESFHVSRAPVSALKSPSRRKEEGGAAGLPMFRPMSSGKFVLVANFRHSLCKLHVGSLLWAWPMDNNKCYTDFWDLQISKKRARERQREREKHSTWTWFPLVWDRNAEKPQSHLGSRWKSPFLTTKCNYSISEFLFYAAFVSVLQTSFTLNIIHFMLWNP